MAVPVEVIQENGLQFLGRYELRPSLKYLNHLFPYGIRPREIVEISGDTAMGKTYMLMDLVARCILPVSVERDGSKKWSGGIGAGVFLLDHGHHFDLSKLVRIMKARLKMCLEDLDETTVETVISSSLRRLVKMDVYSDDDLAPSLLSARNYIFANSGVSLFAIDSIGAHYWQSVAASGIRKMDSYVDNILKQIHQVLGAFQVSFVYTKPFEFASKLSGFPADLSVDFDLRNVNTKVKIKQYKANETTKLAEVHYKTRMHTVCFEINENGIGWSKPLS